MKECSILMLCTRYRFFFPLKINVLLKRNVQKSKKKRGKSKITVGTTQRRRTWDISLVFTFIFLDFFFSFSIDDPDVGDKRGCQSRGPLFFFLFYPRRLDNNINNNINNNDSIGGDEERRKSYKKIEIHPTSSPRRVKKNNGGEKKIRTGREWGKLFEPLLAWLKCCCKETDTHTHTHTLTDRIKCGRTIRLAGIPPDPTVRPHPAVKSLQYDNLPPTLSFHFVRFVFFSLSLLLSLYAAPFHSWRYNVIVLIW